MQNNTLSIFENHRQYTLKFVLHIFSRVKVEFEGEVWIRLEGWKKESVLHKKVDHEIRAITV